MTAFFRNLRFIILILGVLSFTNTLARVDGEATKALDIIDKPDRYDLFFNNEWDNALAPFTYQSSVFLLSGGYLTYLVFKDDFEEKRQRNYEKQYKKGGEKNWVKIGDTLGWGALPVAFLGIQALRTTFMENQTLEDKKAIEEVWQDAEYVTKSVVYTALMTFTMKTLISQGRPKDRLKQDSFPSGHASSSFAFSTAIWLTQGYKWGIFSTLVASWISYSRIEDGSHYYHDSIFGAALGISYALGIYNNHYRRNLPFSFAVAPTSNMDGAYGRFTYNF